MILRVVVRMVARLGAEPHGVASLAEARTQLLAGRFDLVLSDVALGDGSGIDLAASLAADGWPPIVLMSGAHERLEDAARRMDILVLPKPIDLASLGRVLEVHRPTQVE